jgi:hypothetical protein
MLRTATSLGFTTNGVDIALNQATAASVHILNSVFKNNGGVGIRATNAVSPNVQVEVDHTAIILDNKGVEANANSRVVVTNSVVEHAATDGITADSPTAQIHVSTTDSSFNATGITTTLGGNAFVASSSLAFNSSCSFITTEDRVSSATAITS